MKILLLAWPRTGSKAVHENLCRYVNACTDDNVNAGFGYDLFVDASKIEEALEVVKSRQSFVAKVHPYEKKYSFATVRHIAKHFDYVIVLDRDRFDQETSRLVCNRTSFFGDSPEQRAVKENIESYLFTADVDEFKNRVTQQRYLSGPHCNLLNSHNVMFEDFINVKDSKGFCRLFQLEEVDFDYAPGIQEYSETKEKMISNYKELHDWYMTRKQNAN